MTKKNEAKITFIAETKEFSDGIKKANSDITTLKSELKLNAAEIKNNGEQTQLLSQKHSILQKELQAQQSKTQNLNEKLKKAGEIYGKDSDEVTKLTRQLNYSKTAEENIKREINDTNTALKKQAEAAKTNTEATKAMKEGLDKAGNVAGIATGAIAAGSGLAIKSFDDVDQGADNAIKATGAIGEEAKRVRNEYKNVASTIKGDFSEIGSELGEVETRFEFTGKEAENCTKDFIRFAEINNTDATSSVRLISRAMGDANIPAKDYRSVLDQITVAAQASGVKVETLTENIAKYGAPMRALGFDTKESIALFGQWEKVGVNTSIAFSGLKKSISNWSKEGKDPKEEFKKTLEEIKKAPSIAKATTKAIEVFGTKAGPDLADAIQNGRFEYSEFLDTVEKSEGTLENTYSEIQDGTDKTQISMQNLKLAGAEVGEALLEELDPEINSLVENSKEFSGWAKSNGPQIVSTIKGIAVATGGIFVVNKVAKFTQSVGELYKGVTTFGSAMKAMITKRIADTAATEAETVAQTGLNSAMLASPMGMAIVGVGALAAGMLVLSQNENLLLENAKKAQEETDNLTESIQKNNEKVESQYLTYERDLELLEDITDENGKVKEGKEDLAKVIADDLSEQLGIEAELVDGQFKNYEKLREEIEKVIETKKTEALIEANKDTYAEALKMQSDYAKKISEQQKEVSKLAEEREKAEREANGYDKNTSPAQKILDAMTGKDPQQKVAAANEKLEAAQTTLKKYTNAYRTSTDTIINYEKLEAAQVSGSRKEMNRAIAGYNANLKTATTATKKELKQQVIDTKANLKVTKEAYKNGEVDKAAVTLAKRIHKAAVAELESAKPEYEKAGKKSGKQYADGVKSTGKEAGEVAKNVNKKLGDTDFSKAGKKSGKTYGKGIKAGMSDYFKFNPVDISVRTAIKNKGKTKTINTVPGIPSISTGIKLPSNAQGGIYAKGAFVTSFAEDSAEAAIPINNKPRSIKLYRQTGHLMGLDKNKEIGNIKIQQEINLSETNRLLRTIASKDNNLYIDGDRMSRKTATSRDRVDGVMTALARRGVAIE